ncbi:magnesium transporter [Sulfurovum sp.]|jgi:magnesium transporter|uniref:magnesium transporter n=1 Tax=Sulfurovum sp. TaxID=1969726 RepID=UPI002A36C151|nr:magnesium transporter [Sulfurovum sp.]MDD2450955.1 magnesium transporter [Sulfurovum sp.]MDD3498914.1 magnesium transporter [Sulfurovum sp.]MDY0402684.1 magnesium transporter [Sulfurovum sp.]
MNEELLLSVEKIKQCITEYNEGMALGVHPYEIADLLIAIAEEEEPLYEALLQELPHILLAEVLVELPKSLQEDFYIKHGAKELAELTQELDTDDAADLIRHIEIIDESKADEVLSNLSVQDRDTIEELISYEDSEAGAYMQVELFDVHIDETIGDSIKRLKQMKATNQVSNVNHVFVTSDKKKFLGMIPLEDLILHGPKEYYKDIIETEGKITVAVRDTDEIKSVIETVSNYDLSVIAVVNEKGTLLGRITSDDIYDIIEEEATDQIYHLAGVNDEAEQEESLWKVGKSRGIWLGLNLLTAIAASLVIGLFDSTIQSLVALAVLMPIVASMGGNAGTQTLTVTVRQMALGDIDLDEAKETIYKEVAVSLMNGLLYAVVMGLIAYWWFKIPLLGVVIGAAMVINLISAGFFGAVIPLGLKKFGIDPAIGSTVLLTTVTDVVGFFSFLGLATMILL